MGDPDRAGREGAAAPQPLHVGKPNRRPTKRALEMALVEHSRALEKSLVGWPRPLRAAGEAATHYLSPMLSFDQRHRSGHQQLQYAGAQPSSHCAATFAGRDDANRWVSQWAEL